ncbi:MAG: hypothetical protein BWY83_00993 [bacterium ADurb.Bin478]|nr:MAG: hypothetical protein BWY83_00993 [bacterium ADurb.Bin478]
MRVQIKFAQVRGGERQLDVAAAGEDAKGFSANLLAGMAWIGKTIAHLFHARDDLFQHVEIDKGMEEEAGDAVAQRRMVARCLEQRSGLLPAERDIAQVFRDDFSARRVTVDQPRNQLIRSVQIDGLSALISGTEITVDHRIVELGGAVMRRLPGDREQSVFRQFLHAGFEPFTHVFARIGEQRAVVHHIPELVIRGGLAAILVGVAVHDDHPAFADHVLDRGDKFRLIGKRGGGVVRRIQVKGNQRDGKGNILAVQIICDAPQGSDIRERRQVLDAHHGQQIGTMILPDDLMQQIGKDDVTAAFQHKGGGQIR